MDARKSWTEQELNELKKLKNQNETWSSIAKKLGKSEYGVRNRWRRLQGIID